MPFSVTPKGVFSLKWLARLSLTALFLLPCLYWSLDLLLHLLEEPWYLLANFVLPVAIALVAYACCVCWGRRLGWGYVLRFKLRDKAWDMAARTLVSSRR